MQQDDARDIQLHRSLSSGSKEAFEELYRRYSPSAYGIALRVSRSPVLAQDIVNDTFMALWRAPEAFDASRGTLRTFLLSLAHHRAVDTVRRENRLRKRTLNPVNLDPFEGEDVAEGIVEEAWLGYRRERVRQALETLPEEQKQVLEMAYFGGRTQVEIAEAMGIPLGTVKTRTLSAMRKLRRGLEEEEE